MWVRFWLFANGIVHYSRKSSCMSQKERVQVRKLVCARLRIYSGPQVGDKPALYTM